MTVVTALMLTIIRGYEEPVECARYPQLDCLFDRDSVNVGSSYCRALLNQVVHRAVSDPAAQDQIDAVDAACQAATAASYLGDDLLRDYSPLNDFPDRQVRSFAKGSQG